MHISRNADALVPKHSQLWYHVASTLHALPALIKEVNMHGLLTSSDRGRVVELVPAGSETGVLRELVSAVDEATLESVALGGALYAGIEFARPRVSVCRVNTLQATSQVERVFGIDCSCLAPFVML
eukprot:14459-Heterococcus_DN1.PRE.6